MVYDRSGDGRLREEEGNAAGGGRRGPRNQRVCTSATACKASSPGLPLGLLALHSSPPCGPYSRCPRLVAGTFLFYSARSSSRPYCSEGTFAYGSDPCSLAFAPWPWLSRALTLLRRHACLRDLKIANNLRLCRIFFILENEDFLPRPGGGERGGCAATSCPASRRGKRLREGGGGRRGERLRAPVRPPADPLHL